jgi:uncharacterized protein (DUF1778 family)
MNRRRGRPKKTHESVKAEYMEVRLDILEKQVFQEAAVVAGLSLSAWVRNRLRQAARAELAVLGRRVAFLDLERAR